MKKIIETNNDGGAKLRRYNELKAMHEDRILLFRCGDFYEAYGEDALGVASELNLTPTNVDGTPMKMAAFPLHALDTYLPRLIRAGRKVAIHDYD